MPEYKTRFTLDKAYYQECFEQSVIKPTFQQAYFKGIVLLLLGGVFVVFTQINPYAAWFVFALGVLEVVAQYYRKPWWVTRQMLSRAAKGEVELTINDNGIATHSFYNEQLIQWSDISHIEQTECGWVIVHKEGRSYLSQQHLDHATITLLTDKQQLLANE